MIREGMRIIGATPDERRVLSTIKPIIDKEYDINKIIYLWAANVTEEDDPKMTHDLTDDEISIITKVLFNLTDDHSRYLMDYLIYRKTILAISQEKGVSRSHIRNCIHRIKDKFQYSLGLWNYSYSELWKLHLDKKYYNALDRGAYISKIDDLKELVDSGEISNIRSLGSIGVSKVVEALENYYKD